MPVLAATRLSRGSNPRIIARQMRRFTVRPAQRCSNSVARAEILNSFVFTGIYALTQDTARLDLAADTSPSRQTFSCPKSPLHARATVSSRHASALGYLLGHCAWPISIVSARSEE